MTQEELAQQLSEALQTIVKGPGIEPGTITRSEYQKARQIGEKAARTQLAALVESGHLKHTLTDRPNAWGVIHKTQAYKVAE